MVVCECSGIWGGEGVPVGVGRMCRGHHQQCLGEGMRVCLQVCPLQVNAILCVFGGWVPPLVCVEECGAVYHCLCLLQSCQLFLRVGVSVLQGCGNV